MTDTTTTPSALGFVLGVGAETPLPEDVAIDPTYEATLIAGSSSPAASLANRARLVMKAALDGRPGIHVAKDGTMDWHAAAGDPIAFSSTVPRVESLTDPASARQSLAQAVAGFDALDAERDRALAEAEAQFDGKALARAKAEAERRWDEATVAQAGRVAGISRQLERLAAWMPRITGETVVTAEHLGWSLKNMLPGEFFDYGDSLADSGTDEQVELLGALLRKNAVAYPSYWKGHESRLVGLLQHPRIADGGPAGRAREAVRAARLARQQVLARLGRVAAQRAR